MLQRNDNKKTSQDFVGTPAFDIFFLKECLEHERESAELMKKLLEENKLHWKGSVIKQVEDIIQLHRLNYKKYSKQLENL